MFTQKKFKYQLTTNDRLSSFGLFPEAANSGFIKQIYISIIGLCVLAVALFSFAFLRRGPDKNLQAPILSPGEIQAISDKAARGDAQAQRTLGALFAKGQNVKQDYHEAAKWYQLAATQNDAPSQCALGELYEAGRGVPQDSTQAANWYRRAAEQGLATAQYDLALLYATGNGVKLSNPEALKWFLQAANQGDSLAQYNVGMRYFEGHGISRDPAIAYKWLSLAGDQGLPDARQALEAVKRSVSADQLTKGRELLKQFHPGWRATP